MYLSRSQVHLIINILRNCQTCKKEFSRKKTKKHHLRNNIHILNIHTIPTFHTEKGDHSACTTQENFTVDIVATKKPPMKKIHRKLPIILLYNKDIQKICLVAEGSLFWSENRKDKNYNILVLEKLQELLNESALADVEIHINNMNNANLIGTGIAALS